MKRKFNTTYLIAITLFIMGCKNATAVNQATDSVSKKVQIKGAVGQLSAELCVPALEPYQKCSLVILMHGFMSSKDDPLIAEIADQLLAKGIASVRFDFNGHGESDGEFIDMTVPLEVADARSVFSYCKNLGFVSDISLLGHSQGGVVASLLGGQLQDSVKSIVLLAPAAVLVDDSKKGTIFGITYDPVNIPPFVEVFNHKLGRDYIQSAQNLDIYSQAGKFTGPVCLIHGKADWVVPFSYSQKYHDVYANSSLHLFENENHMFSTDVSKTMNTVLDFFNQVLMAVEE